MAKATTKTNTTNKTNKATEAKKTASKSMTWPQYNALVNALFHSNKTKADLSNLIDKVVKDGKGMAEDKKQAWLEKSGQEHCTYGQCKMYAYTLLKNKASYADVSAIIAKLDEANGYTRSPKEAVDKGNKEAKANAPKAKEGKKNNAKARA